MEGRLHTNDLPVTYLLHTCGAAGTVRRRCSAVRCLWAIATSLTFSQPPSLPSYQSPSLPFPKPPSRVASQSPSPPPPLSQLPILRSSTHPRLLSSSLQPFVQSYILVVRGEQATRDVICRWQFTWPFISHAMRQFTICFFASRSFLPSPAVVFFVSSAEAGCRLSRAVRCRSTIGRPDRWRTPLIATYYSCE